MSPGGDTRWIGFRVDGVPAALPLRVVREVMPSPPVARVPGAHPFVRGVALHSGVALPVYDLARFEPLWAASRRRAEGRDAAEAGQLIVCDWGEVTFGLLGERVDLLEAARPAGTAAGPGNHDGMDGTFVSDVLEGDGEAIVLLDMDRLFRALGVPAVEPRGRREAGEDDPAGG